LLFENNTIQLIVKEGSRESLDSRVSKWSIYEAWQYLKVDSQRVNTEYTQQICVSYDTYIIQRISPQ